MAGRTVSECMCCYWAGKVVESCNNDQRSAGKVQHASAPQTPCSPSASKPCPPCRFPLMMMPSWQDKQSAAELPTQRTDWSQRHKQLQPHRSRSHWEGQRPTISFGDPLVSFSSSQKADALREGVCQLVAPQLDTPHPGSSAAAAAAQLKESCESIAQEKSHQSSIVWHTNPSCAGMSPEQQT